MGGSNSDSRCVHAQVAMRQTVKVFTFGKESLFDIHYHLQQFLIAQSGGLVS